MRRRHFIRLVGISSFAVAFPLLNACAGASGGASSAASTTGGGAAGTAAGAAAGATIGLVSRPVIDWFRDLAVTAGGEIIAQIITDWFGIGSTAALAGEEAARIMSNSEFRFSDLNQSPVYLFRDSNIYSFGAVSFVNPVNACAPMVVSTNNSTNTHMVEGPGLVGLSLLSSDVTRAQPANLGRPIQRTMLPAGPITSNGWDFRFDHDGFAEYPTTDGSMHIDYRNNQPNRGEIHVNARDFQGGRLAEGVYEIEFA
jgi:hypothetical protein